MRKRQVDELGELKRKAVYNSTQGTSLLWLNRENWWGKYNIEPIEHNSGCFWILFLADTDLIATVTLHTSLPSHYISANAIVFKKSRWSPDWCLLLGFWHFFNEDTTQWMPTSVGVRKLMACDALSNPESNSHLSFLNVITVTFNVAVMLRT